MKCSTAHLSRVLAIGAIFITALFAPQHIAIAGNAQDEQRQRAVVGLLKDAGVETSTTLKLLNANVFVHQGSVVAFPAYFVQMLEKTEAVFEDWSENRPFFALVSGVPPARFVSRESVVLAVRVVGKKTIDTEAARDIQVPHLQYIGDVPYGAGAGLTGYYDKEDVDAALRLAK